MPEQRRSDVHWRPATGGDARVAHALAALLPGLVVVATLVALSAAAPEPATPAEGPSWSRLEKDFRKAYLAKDVGALGSLVGQVAAFDDPRAARLLANFAIVGFDYDLEMKAGRILAGMKSASARKVIYKEALRNRNYQTRIVLLGVAFYQRSDSAAYRVLVEALKDRRKEVVLTAIRWLRKAGDRKAVDALIEALEQWERNPWGRVYFDIRRALRELIGEDFQIAADWKNYWEARKQGAPPPPPRGGGRTTRFSRSFFTIAIESDRIAFLIDVSTSMDKKDPPIEKPDKDATPRGKTVVAPRKKKAKKKVDPESLPLTRQRLYRVKQELIRTIQSLPKNVFFTVESFSHETHFLDDRPSLIPATSENKEKAVAWVRKMKPYGETWTDTAFEELFKRVKGCDTVILLSDGAPRRKNTPIPQETVLAKIRVANRFAKCRIHTIGFKQAGSNLRRFLEALAAEHDGTFVQLE